MLFSREKSIESVQGKFDFDSRRRSARILVIDDDENSFEPFKPLQREGYGITFWTKVEDLTKLEQGHYDIVILDILGVGQEWSPDEQGFGILELLKARNPGQIVVAYSGETFDFSKQKFYRMADDMIPKQSVDPAKCKSVIDNLIATRLSPSGVWGQIREILRKSNVSERKIQKVERKVAGVLEENPSEPVVREILKGVVSDKDVWAGVIILVAKLCLSAA
jgi:DNA-binding NtrC family response regulator